MGQHQKASSPSSRFILLYTDSKFRMSKRQSAWIIISFRTFRKCAVILDTWRQLLLDNVPFWNLLNGFEDSLWRYPYVFNYVVTALSAIASAPLLFAVFNSPEEKFFYGRFFFLYLKFCPPVMREGEQNTFSTSRSHRLSEVSDSLIRHGAWSGSRVWKESERPRWLFMQSFIEIPP